MRARTLLVVGLVLVAGCSGIGGQTDDTATERLTSETETPGEPMYPDGVTEAGLTNTTALLIADRAARNGSSYEIEFWVNNTIERGGQSVPVTLHTVERAGTGGEPVYYWFNQSNGEISRQTHLYGSSSGSMSKNVYDQQVGNATVTYRRAPPVSQRLPDQGPPLLRPLVQLGNYTTIDVSGTGEATRITLEATAVDSTAANDSENEVTAYDGTLVVDGAGRIRSLNVSTTINSSGGRNEIVADYELRNLGENVTVSEPAWYETAQEEAPDIRLEATAVDGTAIEVTNAGNDTIEAGRTIVVRQDDGPEFGSVATERAIEPGDSLFLYRNSTQNRFQQARSSPSDAATLTGTYRIHLDDPQSGVPIGSTVVTFD